MMSQSKRKVKKQKLIAMVITFFIIVISPIFWLTHQSQAKDSSKMFFQVDKDIIEITLSPSKIHEECLKLSPGQTVTYSFKASEAIRFNIHYHEKDEVIYPVSVRTIKVKKDAFQPKKKQVYCLMWQNPISAKINLAYQFEIQETKEINKAEKPIYYRVSQNREAILMVEKSGELRGTIEVGIPIHNFALNRASTLLVVLTPRKKAPVQIYEVATQKLRTSIHPD